MAHPNYLKIEEQVTVEAFKVFETPMYICIPVVDFAEAIELAPKHIKEFTDKTLAYKAWFHSHTHNVEAGKNSPCKRTEIIL